MPGEAIRVRAKGKAFTVFVTPDKSQIEKIGNVVRFTADNKAKILHVWNYNAGAHSDVLSALKLRDSAKSTDILKGSATKGNDGSYALMDLHLLKSFATDWTPSDMEFLSQLLNQDWSWVDSFIQVTRWLSALNDSMLPPLSFLKFE